MDVLYIIGNGFDKAQGMKTSYPEFYEYLKTKECSPLLEQMKKEISAENKLWADMEEAIGRYTSKIKSVEEMDSLHAELSDHLQDFLQMEDENFSIFSINRSKFLSDFMYPEVYLSEIDEGLFGDFLSKLPDRKIVSDYHVITLNYTNTFEKLMRINHPQSTVNFELGEKGFILRDIYHVHGKLGESIIIGVDNKDQIKNDTFKFSDEIKSFLIKSEANEGLRTLRHKMCEQLIKKTNLIVLFGVSFGDTDLRWWKLIGEELKLRLDIGVIAFLYCPGEITNRRRFKLASIEQRERSRIYSKMDIDDGLDIDNRFFLSINSSMFQCKQP